MIILDNAVLIKLISDKDALVNEGRKITGELEKVERQITSLENKEKAITAKAPIPKEMQEKGDYLLKHLQDTLKELDEITAKIQEEKMKAIPKEMEAEHKDLMKKREELERDRNKIALKVQKVKDKVVPLIQKAVKPLLKEEFDDVETAKIKDGKLEITTFNHRRDWERTFRQKSR